MAYYETIQSLVEHHKYSVTEIENMLPFERDLYIDLIIKSLSKQKSGDVQIEAPTD